MLRVYTYVEDSGVWGCHLRLAGLMKINPCWSDSSLSSQADRPGGQFRHLYGGYYGLVLLVSSLSAIVAKCEVGGWLVSSPL